MADRRCPACRTPNAAEANYCSVCGENLDAVPVDLSGDQRASEALETQSRFAGLTVPLIALAVLGLIATLLFLSNGSEPTDEAVREDVPTPTAGPTPAPTTQPSPEPTGTSRPTPTPTPIVVVDPTVLPDLDATHLALAYRTDVFFLDLTSGEWTTVDTGASLELESFGPFGPSSAISPFGAGILVRQREPTALHVMLDGQVETVGNEGGSWLLGVRNDLAFFESWFEPDASGPAVDVFDANGARVDTIELPNGAGVEAIAPDGRILVQSGGRIFALSGRQATEIAAGESRGMVGDHLLVHSCDASMQCTVDAFDMSTMERFPTNLPPGDMDAFEDGSIILWGPDEPRRFDLVDGTFVETADFDFESFDPFRHTAARDSTGLWGVVDDGSIVFSADQRGEDEMVRIPWPAPERCCGSVAITFLSIDDAP